MDSDETNFLFLLPSELLLLVFQNLPSLNEPPSLAITCKSLYKFFKFHERKIAWSLIVIEYIKRTCPQHIFDVRLCCLADALHGEDEDITLQTPGGLYGRFEYDSIFSATVESVAVIDRYLRRIRLWWKQAAQLRSNYVSHINEYRDALSYENSYHHPEENYVMACSAGCKRQIGPHLLLPNRNERKSVSQEKFYRAVIACTFETKLIQLLAINLESEDEVNDSLSERIYADWFERSNYTLRESFENLEIFDYTSNFLLQNVFDSPHEYQDWDDETFDFGNDRNMLLNNWMHFHRRLQTILTPFDILSLFTYGMGSDEMREKNSLYLKNFLSMFFVYDMAREYLHVERDMLRNPSEPKSKAWKHYRSRWTSAIRGRVFSNDFEVVDFSVAMHLDDASSRESETVGAR
ncbi:uncharacterized protein N7511_008478 [Penicillium nucicola]|uniref:uncharacterized protein n=1 Tax=Penicillium nucicola TaxID=1850975 RepID=UPI0025459AD0|nr:uncharacterized protein N7511_008478 [Penicillium nucicola]KAJ5751513.1 hypothetical protein N7511_008478 [Penicillium nucicola]